MKDKTAGQMVDRVANRILLAMAYNRNTFKDKVEEHLSGAYLEFYKATLAKKNGHTEWTQHWMSEVRGLLDHNLVAALGHNIKGFKDRKLAFVEVVRDLQQRDASFRRIAGNAVKKDFKVHDMPIPLDDADTATFWARVRDSAHTAEILADGETL